MSKKNGSGASSFLLRPESGYGVLRIDSDFIRLYRYDVKVNEDNKKRIKDTNVVQNAGTKALALLDETGGWFEVKTAVSDKERIEIVDIQMSIAKPKFKASADGEGFEMLDDIKTPSRHWLKRVNLWKAYLVDWSESAKINDHSLGNLPTSIADVLTAIILDVHTEQFEPIDSPLSEPSTEK